MERLLIGFILLLLKIPGISQKAIYEGRSVWLKDSVGLERYEYDSHDSLMIPTGKYELKLQQDYADGGRHELTHLRGQYKNGELEGSVHLTMYKIGFNIVDFDSLDVHSRTTGEKMIISGEYSNGVPSGIWHFTYLNMEKPEDSLQLTYQVDRRELQYESKKMRYKGGLDDDYYISGDWKWTFDNGTKRTYTYRSGILTGITNYPDTMVNNILSRAKILLEKSDSLVPAPVENKWVSMPEKGVIQKAQEPVRKGFMKAFRTYEFAKKQLVDLPGFVLPEIKGTSRIYFNIEESDKIRLRESIAELVRQDSILMKKIELPVFLLRRGSDAVVDSLVSRGEAFIDENIELMNKIRVFLMDSMRLISPYAYRFREQGGYSSHEVIVDFLEETTLGRIQLFEEMMLILDEEQEKLRVRGTVEELEEEWYYMIQTVGNQYKPDSSSYLAVEVYERMVVEDFAERKLLYSSIRSLNDRKDFLQNTITYSRFYYEFFRDSAYWVLEEMDSTLLKEYTQFWYNPYMGVYNVEVVVKRRFLEKIMTVYWPERLRYLKNIDSGSEFISRYEETKELISMLINFSDVQNTEAKRMERQIRRARTAVEIDKILLEYLQSITVSD